MQKKFELGINYNLRKVESKSGFGDLNQRKKRSQNNHGILWACNGYKIEVSVNFKTSSSFYFSTKKSIHCVSYCFFGLSSLSHTYCYK